MELGFAAKVLGPDRMGLPAEDARRHQNNPSLGRSLELAEKALDWIEQTEIRFWRLPSHMAPYGSHPTFTQFWGQPQKYQKELTHFGDRINALNIRVTKHPGQYTLLSSPREDVLENSVRDLSLQAEILDRMGISRDTGVMILHLGGKYNDPIGTLARLHQNYHNLPDHVKARLVFENDDRVWETSDVLNFCEQNGIRMVFDFHHHRCFNTQELSSEEALRRALATWPDHQKPKVHISSGKAHAHDRAHADQISYDDWQSFGMMLDTCGRDVDVMLEAKDKDYAVLNLADHIRNDGWYRPHHMVHLPTNT